MQSGNVTNTCDLKTCPDCKDGKCKNIKKRELCLLIAEKIVGENYQQFKRWQREVKEDET